MGFARTCSVALVGVEGVVVEVQADLEPGVAAFTLVGLPDKSLIESRERVRAAVVFPVKSFCSGQAAQDGVASRGVGRPGCWAGRWSSRSGGLLGSDDLRPHRRLAVAL